MKKNFLRTLIGGLSFTTALFVFQACYGTPQSLMDDVLIEGKVISCETGNPIENIKISVGNRNQYQYTDSEGKFAFYTVVSDHLSLSFQDTTRNISEQSLDTVVDATKDIYDLNICF